MSDHERVVLGSLMLNGTLVDEVADIIAGPEFADPRHEEIFTAILRLAQSGKPTDAVAVGDALGERSKVITRAYLFDLVAAVSVADSVAYYAQKVREAHYLRTVRSVAVELQGLADYEDDPIAVVNAARERLDALVMDNRSEVPFDAAVWEAVEALEEPTGTPTPWRGLDRAIAGWSPGMLYVIGARPSIGKTVIGGGIALDMARRGYRSLLFSMEMPRSELIHRLMSAVESIDGGRVRQRSLTEVDWRKVRDAANHLSKLPIDIDDRSNLSIAQMRARIRREQRKGDLGVVVVDYLGLVKPPKDTPRNDRRVQVDAIAQGLKDLSRDLRVPIVALAQLNRGIEGRADKVPTLADLRESGGIEAAGDVILLLHRDRDNNPTDLEVHIRKNRHGEQGMFRLDFQGQFSRAVDPIGTAPLRAV